MKNWWRYGQIKFVTAGVGEKSVGAGSSTLKGPGADDSISGVSVRGQH